MESVYKYNYFTTPEIERYIKDLLVKDIINLPYDADISKLEEQEKVKYDNAMEYVSSTFYIFVKILSHLISLNNYHLIRVAQEMFPAYAKLPSSVFKWARAFGYPISLKSPAIGIVRLKLPSSIPSYLVSGFEITVDVDKLSVSFGGKNFMFLNPFSIVVRYGEGELKETEDYFDSYNNTFYFYKQDRDFLGNEITKIKNVTESGIMDIYYYVVSKVESENHYVVKISTNIGVNIKNNYILKFYQGENEVGEINFTNSNTNVNPMIFNNNNFLIETKDSNGESQPIYLYQVEKNKDVYTITNTMYRPYFTIKLEKNNLISDFEFIKVYDSNGNEYKVVSSFFDAIDRKYAVVCEVTDDYKLRFVFGDGKKVLLPEINSEITIETYSTLGIEGHIQNVPVGSDKDYNVKVYMKNLEPKSISCKLEMQTPTFNAGDYESIEEIKRNYSRYVSLGGYMTCSNYDSYLSYFSNKIPGILYMNVWGEKDVSRNPNIYNFNIINFSFYKGLGVKDIDYLDYNQYKTLTDVEIDYMQEISYNGELGYYLSSEFNDLSGKVSEEFDKVSPIEVKCRLYSGQVIQCGFDVEYYISEGGRINEIYEYSMRLLYYLFSFKRNKPGTDFMVNEFIYRLKDKFKDVLVDIKVESFIINKFLYNENGEDQYYKIKKQNIIYNPMKSFLLGDIENFVMFTLIPDTNSVTVDKGGTDYTYDDLIESYIKSIGGKIYNIVSVDILSDSYRLGLDDVVKDNFFGVVSNSYLHNYNLFDNYVTGVKYFDKKENRYYKFIEEPYVVIGSTKKYYYTFMNGTELVTVYATDKFEYNFSGLTKDMYDGYDFLFYMNRGNLFVSDKYLLRFNPKYFNYSYKIV